MLSLSGVHCCVRASGIVTYCWVVWCDHCIQTVDFARLSVVVDDDEEHDEWRDLVQCDRLWLIRPIRAR